MAGAAVSRRGSPSDGTPDRARPDKPAVNRLAKQGDVGDAVAWQGCTRRGPAGLRSEPAGAVRPPPGGRLARGVDDVDHCPLKRRLKLRDFIGHTLL